VRLLRSTFTAGLALAAALALPGVASAKTVTPEGAAAEYGAGYLGRLLDPTGYIAALSGPDYTNTANAVLALVAAGVGEEQAAEATAYLLSHVDEAVVDENGDDKPGALAVLIMVAHARGEDASALVTRLLATKQTTGADAGLFGEQYSAYDGTYRQALSLLALAAVGQTDADAVAWLKDEQCADGGWMGNNPDPSAACPAFDFNSFIGEDSNGTALAAQALAALGETPAHDPLGFLRDAQNDDGGFGFVPGFDSDANSTALAVQALLALGEDLGGWAGPDGTPYAFLLSLQLGNPPAKTAGAFAFQPGTGGALTANVFATVQVVPALAGVPYPVPPRELSNDLPLLPAQVTPTPSVPPAPTSAPTPVASPTRLVDPAPVPTLVATGGIGEKPWDATGQVVFALGLIGYGVLALGGAKLLSRKHA
jgi:hypothetical protein